MVYVKVNINYIENNANEIHLLLYVLYTGLDPGLDWPNRNCFRGPVASQDIVFSNSIQ